MEKLTLEFTKEQVNAIIIGLSAGALQINTTGQLNKLLYGKNEPGEKYLENNATEISEQYMRFMKEAGKIWPKG